MVPILHSEIENLPKFYQNPEERQNANNYEGKVYSSQFTEFPKKLIFPYIGSRASGIAPVSVAYY